MHILTLLLLVNPVYWWLHHGCWSLFGRLPLSQLSDLLFSSFVEAARQLVGSGYLLWNLIFSIHGCSPSWYLLQKQGLLAVAAIDGVLQHSLKSFLLLACTRICGTVLVSFSESLYYLVSVGTACASLVSESRWWYEITVFWARGWTWRVKHKCAVIHVIVCP